MDPWENRTTVIWIVGAAEKSVEVAGQIMSTSSEVNEYNLLYKVVNCKRRNTITGLYTKQVNLFS